MSSTDATPDAATEATSTAQSVARATAPLITMGATWAVRRAMISVYEARTGRPAPLVYSRDTSLRSRLLWAATMAGVLALVEVIVWQVLDND